MDWLPRRHRNKDGKLNKVEIPSPRFNALDAGGEGAVTLAEYTAYPERIDLSWRCWTVRAADLRKSWPIDALISI